MNYVEVSLERITYNAATKEFSNTGTDVYRFRLTSQYAAELEKKAGKNIVEFIKEFSMNNVVTMLRYMLLWENPTLSLNKAYEIYDELVLNGYDLQKIQDEIILEALIASGFFQKEQVEEAKTQQKQED